jgi:hypothetical protein
VIIAFGGSNIATSSNYGVFTNNESPYGTPYREWMANYWTWWLGIPDHMHPASNYTDSNRCSAMQNGSVWFLPDIVPGKSNTIEYSCSVPSGKAILLPITSTECDKNTPDTKDSTYEELATVCADNILTSPSQMEVKVDNSKVDVSKSLFDKTGFFNVTYPQDPVNFWGAIGPGTFKGFATGYFLFLHDLPPGKHTIDLKVTDQLKGKTAPEQSRVGHIKISMQ